MKVSKEERTKLIGFIVHLSQKVSLKEVAKFAVYVSILEAHQHHAESIKIVHKGLKTFIAEVRICGHC